MALSSSSNRKAKPKIFENMIQEPPCPNPPPPNSRGTQALRHKVWARQSHYRQIYPDRTSKQVPKPRSNNYNKEQTLQSSQTIRQWIRSTQRHCSTKTPQSSKNNPLAKRTNQTLNLQIYSGTKPELNRLAIAERLTQTKGPATTGPECSKTWSKYRLAQQHTKTRFNRTRYSTFQI